MAVIRQRVANLSKDSVVDEDFASETELSEAINTHTDSYAHFPVADNVTDIGKVATITENGYEWQSSSSLLPSQDGHEGKALVTDGSSVSWQDVSPLGWKDNIVPLSAGSTGIPETAPLYADSGNGIWGTVSQTSTKTTLIAISTSIMITYQILLYIRIYIGCLYLIAQVMLDGLWNMLLPKVMGKAKS